MDTGRHATGLNASPFAKRVEQVMREVHDQVSAYVERTDGAAPREDQWDYRKGAGGGITRVWEESSFVERGGANFSAIHGKSLPESAATQFQIAPETPFFATGVSVVIHPWNPHVPTIHMNIRYFEAGDIWWFGGGIDLTPYYPEFMEIFQYHGQLKQLCDQQGEDYGAHKKYCDDYFAIRHRNERRGVGGLFFDHLNRDAEAHLRFVHALGMAFPNVYELFVANHRNQAYTEAQREFQLFRRSRYVEFNLVYDRGTRFGLQSQGRIDSILMSMPAQCKWKYDYQPEQGTPEHALMHFYLVPQDWLHVTKPLWLR